MLEKGQKYKVTLRNGRWFVGTYLGTNYAGDRQFNLRPLAGTQSVPDSQIRVYKVSETSRHSLGTLA
jgi:hypothetical protein